MLGDLLPKFFAPMVLHLLDFLPCQRKLTEGLSDLQIEPEGAPSHALRSPHNPSGTPCHLPLHRGGCELSREIAPSDHKTVAPRPKIRYTIGKGE